MRKYVIMGVQGSGKGTQAMLLAADLDLVHISVGDIFRWNVQHHTKLGAQVRRTMAGGELVGDDLVEGVVKTRLAEHDWNFGFIIDGFPRNERQAEFFLESYDIDGVIHLEMPDSEVRRRVMARRLCAGCGMDYNLLASTPHTAGRCDVCGGELVTREDDTEEALAVRLRDYHQKTNPVLDIFRRKEYVVTVDARPGREIVQKEIRERLGLPPCPPRPDRPAPDSAAAGADAGCGSCSRPTRSRAPSARRTRPPRWPGGWRAARAGDEVACLPLADGGEGTLDVLAAAVPGARWHPVTVTGPGGAPAASAWLELPGRRAAVELARASGLPLLGRPDPLGATTAGTGELIAAALGHGAEQIVMGVGGSASTDGGCGALAALGARFLDARGAVLPPGGGALRALASVDLSGLRPPPPGGVTVPDRRDRRRCSAPTARPPCSARRRARARPRSPCWRRGWPGWRDCSAATRPRRARAPRAAPATASRPPGAR